MVCATWAQVMDRFCPSYAAADNIDFTEMSVLHSNEALLLLKMKMLPLKNDDFCDRGSVSFEYSENPIDGTEGGQARSVLCKTEDS